MDRPAYQRFRNDLLTRPEAADGGLPGATLSGTDTDPVFPSSGPVERVRLVQAYGPTTSEPAAILTA